MKEVLNKIEELVSFLEEKNKVTKVLNSRLSEKTKNIALLEEKAIATKKNLAAMERIYKKYVDFDNEKKKFELERQEQNKKIAEAQHQEDNDAIVLQEIKDAEKKLDARKLVLTKQSIAIKEKETNFDKKRKDLQNMISGQAIKDILK